MTSDDKRDTIIIIDDETVIVDSIVRTLSGDNYQLYSAGNGKDGLDLLDKYDPVLILLDLRMPVMDGLEFLKHIELKADDPYGVIVLTGHGTMEHMQKCYRYGVHAFLRKPFNIFELKGLVKNIVTMKKYQRQLSIYSEQLEDMVEQKAKNITYLNSFLDTIFHTVPIGIAVVGDDGDILRCNSTLLNLLKGNNEQVSNDNINYLLSSVSIVDLQEILKSSLDGSTEYFESNIQRYDSTTFPAMVACTHFINENQKSKYLFSISDLTDQKALASKIEEQRITLIAQDRLRVLGEFASGIAHEIKNPLFGLKIASDLSIKMIKKGNDNHEALIKNLTDISQLADTMNQIITRIGKFAHQSGDQELSSVNVIHPIQQAIDMLKKQFKEDNVDVQFIPADVPLIQANSLGIQQIIINILTNARDALNLKAESVQKQDFTKSIVVEAYKSFESEDVIITIADNGSGVPEDLVNKIFNNYFTTKKAGSGLGVGLSISKKIIESFNGRIEIQSELGEGTVFKILFPLSN